MRVALDVGLGDEERSYGAVEFPGEGLTQKHLNQVIANAHARLVGDSANSEQRF